MNGFGMSWCLLHTEPNDHAIGAASSAIAPAGLARISPPRFSAITPAKPITRPSQSRPAGHLP